MSVVTEVGDIVNDEGKIYVDVLKEDFKELLESLLKSDRSFYHMYIIDRVCIQGALIGFDYRYSLDSRGNVIKELDLGKYGKLEWSIECTTGYGTLSSADSCIVIARFLKEFSTLSKQ